MELKIKSIRESFKLSQEEISRKMGITQSAYARFELGTTKIDLNRLQSFASVLNMNLVDVITYPEKYVNVKDLGNVASAADVILQLKVKENVRDEVLKIVLNNQNIDIL